MEETIELVQGGRIEIFLGITYGAIRLVDEEGQASEIGLTVTDAANLMVALKKLLD